MKTINRYAKKAIFLFCFISGTFAFGQIKFEKGYIIDKNGNKKVCLIKNVDWRNNPTEIEYKIKNLDKIETANINNIIEFGVDNFSKYIVATVKIDRSSENIQKLDTNRNPNFNEENLFLKILVEGKASLYEYVDSNLKRYFFKIDNKPIKQLIYKSFVTFSDKIGKNEGYKQQLLRAFKCSDISENDIKFLKYKKKDLINLFVKYNQCVGEKMTNFEKKKKSQMNLNLRLGVNNTSLLIHNPTSSLLSNTKFKNKEVFRIGVELEYILPFNKNKWGITIEPTYQYYKSRKITYFNTGFNSKHISDVSYKSIEIPLGVRYYMFLNENSKFFINGQYVYNFSTNSKIDFSRGNGANIGSVEIKPISNIAFGVGYNYKSKYAIEIRVQTPREILISYKYWSSEYKTVSFILSYNFLKK